MSWRVVLLALLVTECGPAPRTTQPGGIAPGSPDDCAAACGRLRQLRCPEAEANVDGVACEEICNRTEQSGTVTLDPRCVASIAECAEVDSKCTYGAPP